MVDAGCDVIEVGLPYSDPVMDGPTIQAAAQQALERGIRTDRRAPHRRGGRRAPARPTRRDDLLEPRRAVRRRAVRRRPRRTPGEPGLITPDLTPDAARRGWPRPTTHGLDKVFLVAPSSTDERIAMTTAACRGFVYATAVMGVTGARATTAATSPARWSPAPRPPPTSRSASGSASATATRPPRSPAYADGVIVGSAFVRALLDHPDDRAAGLRALAALTEDLAAGVRRA